MTEELGAHLDELTLPGSLYDFVREPFGVRVGDEMWTAATNGWAMAAIKADLVPEHEDGSAKTGPYLNLCHPAPDVERVDVATLLEFLGEYEPPTDCKRCDRSGEVTCVCRDCEDAHLATCDDCDGDGNIPANDRPVKIGVATFNANLLAKAFGCLCVSDGEAWCRVAVPPIAVKHNGHTIAIWTDDWRIVAMSFAPESVTNLFNDEQVEFSAWLPKEPAAENEG